MGLLIEDLSSAYFFFSPSVVVLVSKTLNQKCRINFEVFRLLILVFFVCVASFESEQAA